MSNVGLSVTRGVANPAFPNSTVPTRNLGILGLLSRGVPNTPVEVTSMADVVKRFGSIPGSNYTFRVLEALFQNAAPGSPRVFVVRRLKGSYAAATGYLAPSLTQTLTWSVTTPAASDAAEVLALTLGGTAVAGYNLTVELPGTWGNPPRRVSITTTGTLSSDATALVTAFNASSTPSRFTASSSGAVVTFTSSLNAISSIADERRAGFSALVGSANKWATFKAGINGSEDPGTWGNSIFIEVLPMGHPRAFFNAHILNVYVDNVFKESFTAPTAEGLVYQVNLKSKLIIGSYNNNIASLLTYQMIPLIGGSNGDSIAESDMYPDNAGGGLSAFDSVRVNIVSCPEFNTATMLANGLQYALLKNCHYVGCLPYNASDNTVQAAAGLVQNNSYAPASMYSLWCQTIDGVWIPGIGHILGNGYISIPAINKDKVHTPPAGTDAAFVNCIAIAPNFTQDQKRINNYVRQFTCNVGRFTEGVGFHIASSRTVSTNALWMSIHTVLQSNYFVDYFLKNYQGLAQKSYTPDLKSKAIAAIDLFMREQYRDEGLENSLTYEEACAIISDSSNNPTTQDRKELNIDIKYIPTECTEAVTINLLRNDSFLTARISTN